jgi:hypothetical protein
MNKGFVIAGLDPAIHQEKAFVEMDARVEPAHDGWLA